MKSKGLTGYYWSSDDYGNSCEALIVHVEYEGFGGNFRNDNFYTLCE
jgi:hypothetical protein